MAQQQGLSISNAIAIMDKTLARSGVKLEEILEDNNGMRQLFSQIITNYEQQLVELRMGNQDLTNQNSDAKNHIAKLEEMLGKHLAADQIPERPKSIQPPQPEKNTFAPQDPNGTDPRMTKRQK